MKNRIGAAIGTWDFEAREILEAAQAKADRGLPLEQVERYALNFDLARTEAEEILAEVTEVQNENDKVVRYTQGIHTAMRLAVRLVVTASYALSAQHSLKRQELEDLVRQLHNRIVDLERLSPSIQGTFDPAKTYCAGAIVARNGASFMARRDNPGPCPGDGWQLSAAQGKRGHKGPSVRSMTVDGQGLLTLTNADGSSVKCDLYPVLEKVRQS